MGQKTKRSKFTGQLGFILAAAGSAVGLGNIWRFPYLAAKDGGGVFLLVYVVLALTFGFTLLTTEVAIGRRTRQSPLTAYGKINKHWSFIGILATIVPALVLPYYCAIGGWVLKYLQVYLFADGHNAAQEGYFTGFITGQLEPVIWLLVFFGITALVVFTGVEKGIERFSKILMPILLVLVVGISVYSLTLNHSEDGVKRSGLDGLWIYLVPDFSGMTVRSFLIVVMDALGQLFYSISVAMGIMITYGSYAPKKTNMMKSINRIELFDTIVALLAGLMIIPATFTFAGVEGMKAGGPTLMFVILPRVFDSMGIAGAILGIIFFLVVSFAAVTSSVSIMEAIVSCTMDKFGWSRKKSCAMVSIYAVIAGAVVCFGYNIFYFELKLPNGITAQILDLMDYVSNNWLMPTVALLTCILIGWVAKPNIIINEVTQGKYKFRRKHLYIAMVKVIAPLLITVLLLQAFGIMDYILALFGK